MMRSIFSRLLISHIAVVAISMLALGILMSYLFRGHIVDNKRRDLLQKGEATVTLLSPALSQGLVPTDVTMNVMSNLAGATIWLMDSRGQFIAGTAPEHWSNGDFAENDEEIDDLFNGTPQSWLRNSHKKSDPALVVAIPVPNTPVPTALFLYAPLGGIRRGADAFEDIMLYSLLIGALLAVGLGYVTGRSFTRPIKNISQAASRFAKGDFSSRTTAVTDDEIGELGRTFNSMASSLARVEQNRRDFLANVSHELKTPVASIQAFAETILDGLADEPAQQERYLKTIVAESHRINRLIHDLLDMAQLDAGELSIHHSQVAIGDFLPMECEKYASQLSPKALRLHIDAPAQLPQVWADPDRLSQVFANLISNAVQHAPPHSVITIGLAVTSPYLAVTVSDSGNGVAPADLPYIWDRFYRVDGSRARRDGGTGLGLAITKRLVNAMNGTITVSSQPGQGASFTFTLPLVRSTLDEA